MKAKCGGMWKKLKDGKLNQPPLVYGVYSHMYNNKYIKSWRGYCFGEEDLCFLAVLHLILLVIYLNYCQGKENTRIISGTCDCLNIERSI